MASQSLFDGVMSMLKEDSYSYSSMDKVLSYILLLRRDIKDMEEEDKRRLQELFDNINEMRFDIIRMGDEVSEIGRNYGVGYHRTNYFHPHAETLINIMSEEEICKEMGLEEELKKLKKNTPATVIKYVL